MAAPFQKPVRVLLEKGCEFQLGIREGYVLELRTDGYLVEWAEWTDPDTGEVHEKSHGLIGYDTVAEEDKYGQLKILKRPQASATSIEGVRRPERVAVEIERMQLRKHYALAASEMLKSGELKLSRDDFEDKYAAITLRGRQLYDEYIAAKHGRKKKRAGAQIRRTAADQRKELEFSHHVDSGRSYWKWFQAWNSGGEEALFDKYRNCGGHSRYSEETRLYVCSIIDTLIDEERASIKSIVEGVQAAISEENTRRERLPVPGKKLPRVGYDYIYSRIFEIAPIDHKIRKYGPDLAYMDMHSLGLGATTSRALERVEGDEYTTDLAVLMKATGLFDHLPESLKAAIGLLGGASRVTISAAIDVHTRCLLALQIVPEGTACPLRSTVEMIYMDKSPISDAAGCTFRWGQGGAPEGIVLDRGSGYITDEAYAVLASLGITNFGAPAGKPWLKPFIERVFRTIHSDLLNRFSGRTFSNVVEKRENDPQARASLTLEAFLGWLVRWTVDAYHTRKHSALGMSPAKAWERAVEECAPRSLTGEEMRLAFGQRTTRKISRNGVRVKHVDYQNDAAIALNFSPGVDTVEVLRWHGDIGAISIRADDGPWTTVTACDPMWIGKTDTDLNAWLAERDAEDEDELAARHRFINDANRESDRQKRLLGLIAMPRSAEDLERDIARFSRHTDTAERRHKFGEYRGILADLDETAGEATPLHGDTTSGVDAPISDEDLME